VINTWPETLPQKFIVDGFNETLPDYVIQTQTKAAVPQQRRTQTASAKPFGGKMVVTKAQMDILNTFWDVNCGLKFLFPEPFFGGNIFVRFLSPPRYECGSGSDYYTILSMEQVP
jgi:hypothetical protein